MAKVCQFISEMEAMASSFRLRPSLSFCASFILVFSALNLASASARLGKSCHGFHTAFSFRLRPSLSFCASFILVFSALNLASASARLGKSCHGFHTAFSFPDFSADKQKLTLLGDAQLLDSGLQISGSQAQSVGGLFYSQPIRLFSPFRTGESMSFSSFFSFSMDANKGDGLAFVIAPSKEFHGMSGPWLGLSPPNPSSDDGLPPLAHTMAIEFDTSMNAEVHDPSENHVGLDIESLVSLATADVSDGFALNDGEKLYAWIDYRAPVKTLEVRLSRSKAERPEKPILSYSIDLSNVWKEEMFVGFSSSTGDSPQRHVIYSWSFITQDPGMWKKPPRFHPDFFGSHNWDHGHGDWHREHDGPHDWHHGPHDFHHGPRDWHHGPGEWHHGHGGDWRQDGLPNFRPHDKPDGGWHPDHHHHPHRDGDGDDSWFDGVGDVWGVVISLLFGAACGTAVAGSTVLVWSFIRRRCLRAAGDAEEDVGILYGYQKLITPDSDVKVDANGYHKLPTTEPQGKTESS